jgi:hypothetical protein
MIYVVTESEKKWCAGKYYDAVTPKEAWEAETRADERAHMLNAASPDRTHYYVVTIPLRKPANE